jgi:hypothetical protein
MVDYGTFYLFDLPSECAIITGGSARRAYLVLHREARKRGSASCPTIALRVVVFRVEVVALVAS